MSSGKSSSRVGITLSSSVYVNEYRETETGVPCKDFVASSSTVSFPSDSVGASVISTSLLGAALGSSLVGGPGSDDVGVGVPGGPTVLAAVGASDAGPSGSSGLDCRAITQRKTISETYTSFSR